MEREEIMHGHTDQSGAMQRTKELCGEEIMHGHTEESGVMQWSKVLCGERGDYARSHILKKMELCSGVRYCVEREEIALVLTEGSGDVQRGKVLWGERDMHSQWEAEVKKVV